MPQLYMDTDQVRSMLSGIHNIQQQMTEQVLALTQQIDYMVGSSWQSPAAVNFGNDYGYCQDTIILLLSDLEGLIIDLNHEVTEWEETGNVFSRSVSGNVQAPQTARYFPFLG